MSRPKGSKNVDVSSFNKELIQDEIRKASASKVEVKQEVIPEKTVLPKYEIAIGYGEGAFTQVVNTLFDFGYICQGGVSVTNYRGLDGNIVMVYCQAMVKCEG